MSSLITDSVTSGQDFLEKISYPITLEQTLTNVLSLYPGKLKAFKLVNQENGKELINFPFNPAVSPMEFMIQQALSQATSQGNTMGAQINNVFAMSLMNNIYKNKAIIEGEIGVTIEDLMKKDCMFVRKQSTGTSLLLADAQGNVDGDVIEIGLKLE